MCKPARNVENTLLLERACHSQDATMNVDIWQTAARLGSFMGQIEASTLAPSMDPEPQPLCSRQHPTWLQGPMKCTPHTQVSERRLTTPLKP